MRTAELLNALAKSSPGIECLLDARHATVTTLYQPSIRGLSTTLFTAAFEVAKQMIVHPDCPPAVKRALEAYDVHTQISNI